MAALIASLYVVGCFPPGVLSAALHMLSMKADGNGGPGTMPRTELPERLYRTLRVVGGAMTDCLRTFSQRGRRRDLGEPEDTPDRGSTSTAAMCIS